MAYICSSKNPVYGCPSDRVCLGSKANELQSLGIDIEDSILESFNYNNIYISSIFLFQIETMANWSEKITVLLSSKVGGTMVLLILTITTFISLSIQGLIIAVYCNNMKRMQDADVQMILISYTKENSSTLYMESDYRLETLSNMLCLMLKRKIALNYFKSLKLFTIT